MFSQMQRNKNIDSKIKKWTIPNSSLEKISGINEDDLHGLAINSQMKIIILMNQKNYSYLIVQKIILSSSLLNKMRHRSMSF